MRLTTLALSASELIRRVCEAKIKSVGNFFITVLTGHRSNRVAITPMAKIFGWAVAPDLLLYDSVE